MKTEVEQAADMAYWKRQFQTLVRSARADGVVVTVTPVPRQPLAMGNYDLVVDVREARVMAAPIDRSSEPKRLEPAYRVPEMGLSFKEWHNPMPVSALDSATASVVYNGVILSGPYEIFDGMLHLGDNDSAHPKERL